MIGLKYGSVELCETDESWQHIAAETVLLLKNLLGTFAVDIQHVGATSANGLLARPVIDIAVGVRFLEDVHKFIPELEGAGFRRRRQAENNWRIVFERTDEDGLSVTHNVFFVEYMGERWLGFLNFKKYMQADQAHRDEYNELKRKNAEKFANDAEGYCIAKAEYTRNIVKMTSTRRYLGTTVTVDVTRSIGSRHPTSKNIVYPINYGIIRGENGVDGSELRAYILGVKSSVSTFTGTVIGIIHRGGDCGDRLVVAPTGVYVNQARIEEAVHFREKFYAITVDALYQKSAGMVVYRKTPDGIEYLLLFQKRSRTWSFPKGHMEMCETEIQTAKREVFEEIGQRLRPHKNFRQTVTYKLAAPCRKTVVLFLAEARDSNVVFESVMSEYRWLKCEEASRFFWNTQYKRILSDAERFIKRLG